MIQFFIIRKVFLSLVPLILFYLLGKMGRKQLKKKSYLSELDKNQIIEGEIVDESSRNR